MNLALDRRSLLMGAAGTAAAFALPACAMRAPAGRFFDRLSLPVGIQLYALGDEPQKDLEGTLAKVAAIGFRDIELPGLLGRDAATIRRAADNAGVSISSIHVGAQGDFSLSNDSQKLLDIAGMIGARQIVVPMFQLPAGAKLQPGEDFAALIARTVREAGADMWVKLAARLNEKAVPLKAGGVSLGYHNHSVEFAPIDKRTGWEILAKETDPALVHFEADIGWIVSAGLDPVAFLKRYSGRVRQLHVKDVKRGLVPNTQMRTDPTEVGTGSVDWARVLPAAYAAGVRHFYYEQEPPFAIPRIEAAAKSYAFLAQLRA
ncbi:sugar phosphate isomerase/epimerase [Sphingopyxis sp.]|jgi:sugar phosphate isomerase/epimerase|uniref:sugar phosphate isomerase/epimerase family protein n=1 Tax=Sphingopyxis sp. TaxID=1908224 RepID=UPI002DF2B174|nr:sugar phosphate isomerase/epimerase [Sphingopyxis sp.]